MAENKSITKCKPRFHLTHSYITGKATDWKSFCQLTMSKVRIAQRYHPAGIELLKQLGCPAMRWATQIWTLSRITEWTIVDFIPCTFDLLQCCNAAMYHSNMLIHSRKTLSTVSSLISSRNFRTPERSSSANPHYCPWRSVLRFSIKKELEEAKSGEYGECGECGEYGAIRKKLSS
jgi:hypothetical protein